MIHGIISILITLIVAIAYMEIRKWRIKKTLQDFESPKEYPIMGVAGRIIGKKNEQLIDFIQNLFDEVKTTPLQCWFGPILLIGVSEPKDIQTILTDENCLNKPYFYNHLHCNSSILATDRTIWTSDRRSLNAAFNIKMLQSYITPLNDKTRILIKRIEPCVHKVSDLYRIIFISMLDMVTRTTMGCEMNLQSDRGEFLYNISKQVMNNIQYRYVRYWLRWDFTYSLTQRCREEKYTLADGNNFMDELYLKKTDELEDLRSHGIDYLKEAQEKKMTNILEKCLILEKDGIFSHDKVLDQMRVIILAGIDTSAITVYGTLLMLAINQKQQDLVVSELRSILETPDCDVNQTHLSNMKYLECVIKESMRLLPPAPFIARQTSADIILEKGIIPKNSTVFINIMKMHRNPQIWGENALEFDPDRFLPENVAQRPPFSYIPFSGGPRNCIGMKYAMISAKITLAHLLRRFKFISNLHFSDIRLKLHLVLEVINEKPIRVEDRIF